MSCDTRRRVTILLQAVIILFQISNYYLHYVEVSIKRVVFSTLNATYISYYFQE